MNVRIVEGVKCIILVKKFLLFKIEGGGDVWDIYVLFWIFEVESKMRLLGREIKNFVLWSMFVEI